MKFLQTFKQQNVLGIKAGYSPFGQPNLIAYCYFIDGLLIDTCGSRMKNEVTSTLFSLPIEQIFITHHHEDHCGNLTEIQRHFDCSTYAHPTCIETLKNPPQLSFPQWLFWGTYPKNYQLTPKADFIKTPNYQFEILHLPGHAVDMCCLYEPQNGWLFSADLYVNHYIKYFKQDESMAGQIQSLKKVLQYDISVLFCGHRPQFEHCNDKLKRKLNFFENFYGQVSTLYRQGYSESAILKKMQLKEMWLMRLISGNELSVVNMIRSVIRDEKIKTYS